MTLYRCSDCQRSSDAPDDHPKVHYGEDRYHYDCLPGVVKDDIFGTDPAAVLTDRQEALARIIAHAEGESAEHLHSAELRAKVVELMTVVNDRELLAHEAAAMEDDSNG